MFINEELYIVMCLLTVTFIVNKPTQLLHLVGVGSRAIILCYSRPNQFPGHINLP